MPLSFHAFLVSLVIIKFGAPMIHLFPRDEVEALKFDGLESYCFGIAGLDLDNDF